MKPFKTYAFIQSLNKGKLESTEQAEVKILEELSNNQYKANYRGVICTAIFNCFNSKFYVDDVYGILKEKNMRFEIGMKIKIIEMKDESSYNNKIGIITHIDDLGQLHGTWGGLAIIPEEDKIEILKENY